MAVTLQAQQSCLSCAELAAAALDSRQAVRPGLLKEKFAARRHLWQAQAKPFRKPALASLGIRLEFASLVSPLHSHLWLVLAAPDFKHTSLYYALQPWIQQD